MLASNILPYGIRQVVLTPIDDAGVEGDPVRLPAARTFSFAEAEEFEELRGDDTVVAVRGRGASVNWDLESGGITLAAYQVMAGGDIEEDGLTPAMTRTFTKKATDSRPYFKVEGRVISDSGGDFHVELPKVRATGDLGGTLADGTFWLSSASGQALGRESDDVIYEFVHNETPVAITEE